VPRFTTERFEDISNRIGYRFSDKAMLARALTHASSQRNHGDYERLEFLGDRVLALVIAEHLFRNNPTHREGDMSAGHSALVRGETCAEAGLGIGLEDLVIIGDSERNKGMHLNRTMLGDIMEALIAAIYLDGGFEAARTFILTNWAPFLAQPRRAEKDAKTFLQEWALGRGLPIPVYRVLSREGPEHEPVFAVVVDVKGKPPAEGTAKSKRGAEQDAAAVFLEREGIRHDARR
jgi:ribonuclease III